jgi:hypothetical protein
VQPGPCQPVSDREFAVPEDPHGSSYSQAFGQGAEHLADATSRGLEPIQDCAVADTEFCLAGLALEIPDEFLTTMATTADEGVDLIIGDAVVDAVGILARVPSRHDSLLAARGGF